MRNHVLLCFLMVLVVFGASCSSLIPKSVEFFQSRVKAVPDKKSKTKEKEKEAAKVVSDKIKEAIKAATAEHSSNFVLKPLWEAEPVAEALSISLGMPETIYTGNPTNLAKALIKDSATLLNKIDDFRIDQAPLVKKAVEGTGLISVPYFIYIGAIFVIGWLILKSIKIYGAFNPAVGAGMAVAKVPVDVLKRGFTEVIKAGEHFKDAVEEKIDDPKTKELVLDMFQRAHKENQSADIQNVVQTITKI